MLRLAHSAPNFNKKSYRTCACGDIETALHLFFFYKLNDSARAILCNRVYNLVTDNKSPEFFGCLSNAELLPMFLFHLHDDEPSHISVAIFCAVDDFLVIDFDNIRVTLCIVYGRFVLICWIFVVFVHADLLQLYIYGLPDASTSVSDAVFITVGEFVKCYIDSSDTVYSFLHFLCVFFRVFLALLDFES